MQKRIAILDQENARVIVAELPDYLQNTGKDDEELATAIMTALGLSSGSCYFMVGDLFLGIDVQSLNSGRGYGQNTCKLDEFTGNFKEDVLEALKDSD